MNEQQLSTSSDAYDNYLSNHFGRGVSAVSRRRRIDSLAANYSSYLPSRKDAKMLEIGPGLGELLEYLFLKCKYTEISAIDLSLEVMEHCNRIVPGRTQVVADSTAYLMANTERFECIFAFHLLEHIPKAQIVSFLKAIRAALASGGVAFIEVPNMVNPLVGLNIRYADFTHEVGFTESSLGFALRSAGFSDVSIFGIRTARNSFLKLVQYSVQSVVNLLLKLMIKIYLPTKRQILNVSICGVARK